MVSLQKACLGLDRLKFSIKYIHIIVPYFQQFVLINSHPLLGHLYITPFEASGFTYHLRLVFDGDGEPVSFACLLAIFVGRFDPWPMGNIALGLTYTTKGNPVRFGRRFVKKKSSLLRFGEVVWLLVILLVSSAAQGRSSV